MAERSLGFHMKPSSQLSADRCCHILPSHIWTISVESYCALMAQGIEKVVAFSHN